MILSHSVFILLAVFIGQRVVLSTNVSTLELKSNRKTVAKIEGFFKFKMANQEELFIVPTSPVTTGYQTTTTTNFVAKWTDGNGSSLIWRTNFMKNKGMVSLTNSSLQIDRADGASANSTWEFQETLVENSSFSYVCSNLNQINSQHDAFMMENVRLQPFDLQNETFGQDYLCAKDRTTTVAPTTPSTPKPKPVIGNWTVTQSDFSCIRLIADLRLKLAYKTADGGNSTAVVQIPPNAEVVKSTSTCGYNVITATSEGDEQVIQLQFKIRSNEWFLTLNFTNNSILAHIPIDQYPSLAYYARLDYITDASTFVNVSKPNERITLQNLVNKTSGEGALSLFKSDTTHFYRCNGEEKTPVVEGFEIWTKSLRVEAFLNNSTTLMKERVCLTDQQNETSDLVPIITGAALAALVLFVLIAYLVGRARARANTYETI